MEPQNVSPSVPVVAAAPKLPPFGQLWKEATKHLQEKFLLYWGIAILPTVLQIAFLALGVGVAGGFMNGFSRQSTAIGITVVGVVALIFLIIIQLWSAATLTYLSVHHDEQLTFKSAMSAGWKHIGSLFWISVLSGLLSLAGFLLFVVPGIIMTVWFTFPLYILMSEGDRGMKALQKSAEYVRGNWGKIFGNMLLVGLIVGVISAIFSFFSGKEPGLLGLIVSSLVSGVLTAFSVLFAARLYLHSKRLKGIPDEAAMQSAKNSIRKIVFGGCAVAVITVIIVVGILASR